MGLRIFEDEPEAPRSKFADDFVGRFRSGYAVNGRPASLSKWRVTTGDPDVADIVTDLLGGDGAQEWETGGEDNLEMFTDAASVNVILESIRQEMVLWGRAGAIRKCDGVEQLYDDAGKGCECPSSLADRKAADKAGKGCKPNITLVFRLADAPDLGKFRFTSGSWSLARDISKAADALDKIQEDDGTQAAKATLTLELVEYDDKQTGAKRRFTKPVVTVKGRA